MSSSDAVRFRLAFLPSINSIAHWQLIVLVGLTLVRGLIYLALFPPWVAPDEPAHFEAVRIIGQEQQIPSHSYYEANAVNPELSNSFQTFRMWELLERDTPTGFLNNGDLTAISFMNYPYPGKLVYAETYPILPHILLAPILRLAAPFNIATELYLLRFVSIIFAIFIILIAWVIIRRVFPNEPQFWLAIPAFIVFLPMYTHVLASVNTDVFAILLASILLLILVSWFDQGASRLKVLLAIALLFLALFIKRTVVFVFLWVGVAGVLYVGYRHRWPMKRVVTISLITLTFVGAILGFVIANSQVLADSFITLFNMQIGQDFTFSFLDRYPAINDLVIVYIKSGLFAFITFWGDFGGANINIPWPWAWGLMALCGLIILGALSYLFDLFQKQEGAAQYRRNILILFMAGIILSLVNAFFPVLFAGPTWGPPARYFFPVIIPIATFFFLGMRQLFPARYRQSFVLPIWLAGLVTYDALVVAKVLIPFLYS